MQTDLEGMTVFTRSKTFRYMRLRKIIVKKRERKERIRKKRRNRRKR